MSPALSRSRFLACVLILIGAACIAFGGVVSGEFVVDDTLWAATRPSPLGIGELARSFGAWGFQDSALGRGVSPIYRPLHTVFMKAVHPLFGPTPWAFHCLSIALHAGNAVLLFVLLGRLLPQLATSLRLAASLLFVVHPAGSEAVLWISAMSELTVTAAILATLLLYLRWRPDWSATRIAAIASAVLVACFIKETAVVLPILIVACEFAVRPQTRKIPGILFAALFIAPLLFLAARHLVIGTLAGGQSLSIDPARIAELALTQLRFLWLPAAPPFALRPPEFPLAAPSAIAAALAIVIGATWTCRHVRGEMGVLVFGLLWIVLALWPAYIVAAVGEGFFNGRQAYLAACGPALVVAATLSGASTTRTRAALLLLAPLLVWMTYSTASSAIVWRSNLEVYRQANSISPGADGPLAGMANALSESGDRNSAISLYGEALARAKSSRARGEYLYAMASLLGQSGRYRESEQRLRELLALQPQNSFAWVGLGNNAWMLGRLGEAADHYRRALALDPGNFEAASNLANVLGRLNP